MRFFSTERSKLPKPSAIGDMSLLPPSPHGKCQCRFYSTTNLIKIRDVEINVTVPDCFQFQPEFGRIQAFMFVLQTILQMEFLHKNEVWEECCRPANDRLDELISRFGGFAQTIWDARFHEYNVPHCYRSSYTAWFIKDVVEEHIEAKIKEIENLCLSRIRRLNARRGRNAIQSTK